jgi:hypothetical protein
MRQEDLGYTLFPGQLLREMEAYKIKNKKAPISAGKRFKFVPKSATVCKAEV